MSTIPARPDQPAPTVAPPHVGVPAGRWRRLAVRLARIVRATHTAGVPF